MEVHVSTQLNGKYKVRKGGKTYRNVTSEELASMLISAHNSEVRGERRAEILEFRA